MDAHERRVRYLMRNGGGLSRENAGLLLSVAYRTGSADDLLTPAQRRRLKHKRQPEGRRPQVRRPGREPQLVIEDETAQLVPAGERVIPVSYRPAPVAPKRVDYKTVNRLLGKTFARRKV